MIKKQKNVFIMIIALLLIMCSTHVFAVEPQVTFVGDNSAKPDETKSIALKITSSEDEIGVVSGTISANGDISIINLSGKNSWNVTYNSNTGTFNAYKAEGTKTEEIISIEYKTENKEGTGTITVSDLELTTTNYETKNAENASETITIKNETIPSSNEDEDNENPQIQNNEETTNKQTPTQTSNKTNNSNTKEANSSNIIEESNSNKVETNTTATRSIPYTGNINIVLSIVSIAIITILAFIGYKKYREI